MVSTVGWSHEDSSQRRFRRASISPAGKSSSQEGSAHVDGGIPIGMNLIPASRAVEELAPTCFEPLIAAKGDPLPLCTTSATIVTRSLRIDFHGHRSPGERFLSGQPIDLSSQLVCLCAIESPGLAPSFSRGGDNKHLFFVLQSSSTVSFCQSSGVSLTGCIFSVNVS